ncbi:class I SAM-dependent methyltransferase [Agriterribacter sp.]|uniref:class I SAM-dependent methyltransferase n=1 Tax=Agriterribacter sp. TaxID=2821509 RepID=UPI002B60C713|nr:class I SAM-dependent methyltransferase [Agriterribacter sp.]HRO44733.1 class I SAM-dependent methyltransferase [Agriterribacter sp.]HRQ16406.1 class I SAM-dependent methyltransferase [Agriterribacter sp.]
MKFVWLLLAGYGFFCIEGCRAQQKRTAQKLVSDTIYTYGDTSADGTGKYYFGREIAQVMGAAGAAWLDRDERQQEENTALAIEKMKLSSSDIVADIGAGTGYYSFKLSEKLPQGKVYAVEIQDEMIAALEKRKAALHNRNVTIIKGSHMSPNLPDHSVDLAIMVDVYHELEYPYEMLQSIKKALKKDGKILLVEYRGEDPAIRIKPLHKTTVVQLSKEMSANGFRLYYQGDFLPLQHFLLYTIAIE